MTHISLRRFAPKRWVATRVKQRSDSSFSLFMPSCFIEINRDALRHNFRQVRALVGDQTRIIAVVKANAYGHGAAETGRVFAEEGAAMLAVTRLEEAIPLRHAQISAPILLLTPPLPDEEIEAVTQDLTCCVACADDARRLSQAAMAQQKIVQMQLKINSGMGRLGVEPEEAARVAREIAALPNVQLEAAWTHFAHAAEADESSTRSQFARFQQATKEIEEEVGITWFHCANSAATLRFPEMRLDCVRPGTLLYGQFPSDEARQAARRQGVELRDGFRACARVVTLREVKRGQTVGYGGEWKAARDERIATITVGYADGLTLTPDARTPNTKRLLSSTFSNLGKGLVRAAKKDAGAARQVTWNGRHAPIVGRIAMQQCSVLVTHWPQMQVGDVVSVSMRRLAAGAHLPRIYVDD